MIACPFHAIKHLAIVSPLLENPRALVGVYFLCTFLGTLSNQELVYLSLKLRIYEYRRAGCEFETLKRSYGAVRTRYHFLDLQRGTAKRIFRVQKMTAKRQDPS